jgi:hypothetical protein
MVRFGVLKKTLKNRTEPNLTIPRLALVLLHWSLTSSLGLGENWRTGMTSITSPSNPSNARRNDILLMRADFQKQQKPIVITEFTDMLSFSHHFCS